MFCYNCGSKLSEDARFCENCGVAVTAATAPAEEKPAPEVPPIPHYIPPQYAAPAARQPERSKSGQVFSILSLVFGLGSLMMSWIPVVGLLMILAGILAVVFGIIALVKKGEKSMAIAGLILGIAAIFLSLIVSVFVFVLFEEMLDYSYIY